MSKTILFLVNNLSFLASHRFNLIEASLKDGYKVKIGYGELGNADISIFSKRDIDYFNLPIKRASNNIFKELKSIFSIWYIFITLKPSIVHLITIKPYLYGGIASRFAKIPCVVSSIAGLGILASKKGWRKLFFQKLLYPLFLFALNHRNQIVIVQNLQDKKTLVNWIGISKKKISLINGSGVDLSKFKDLKETNKTQTICFASRLLHDKGVLDYISAARMLKKRGIKAKFLLAGSLDLDNPNSLTRNDLNKIIKEKIVNFIGYQKDINTLFSKSHIICLPSFYGEGLPKVLIEAASASRAVVTTNTPGCIDAIIPNKTGLIVPFNNPKKLADAIQWLIKNPSKRKAMGKAGRKLAEKKFKIEDVTLSHLEIYRKLLKNYYK